MIEHEKSIENEKKDKRTLKKILVNCITALRSLGSIAIIPIFLELGTLAAGIAAIGFFVTDCIDGFLARKFHVQTFFGSLLDGISDKFFGIVCLFLLSTLNPLFLVLIGLEIGILAINYKSIERGNNAQSSIPGKIKTVILSASVVGNFFCYAAPSLKTLLNYIQASSLNTALEYISEHQNLIGTLLAIPAIGSSIYVAIDYNKKAKKQDKRHQEEETEQKIDENDIADSITLLHQQKRELLEQKAKVVQTMMQLKSRDEIVHDLFDTDFYLEHKDDGIKRLFYKKSNEGFNDNKY